MEDVALEDPRVLALAKAHQEVIHESVWRRGTAPSWEGLTEAEKMAALIEARDWLRAAGRIGFLAHDHL